MMAQALAASPRIGALRGGEGGFRWASRGGVKGGGFKAKEGRGFEGGGRAWTFGALGGGLPEA